MFKFKVQSNSELRRFSADPTNLADITKRAQGLFGLSELPRLEIACPDGSLTPLVDLGQLQSLSHLKTFRLVCSPVSEDTSKEAPAEASTTTLPNGKRVAPHAGKEEKEAKRAALEARKEARQEARQQARAARELAAAVKFGDKQARKAAKAEARAQKSERQIALNAEKQQPVISASSQPAQDAGAAAAPSVSKAAFKALAKAERQAQKAARQAFKAEERALCGDHQIEEDKQSRGKGALRAEKLPMREASLADKASRRAERGTKKAERAALKAVKDAAKAKLAAAWLTDIRGVPHFFIDGYNVAGSMPELRHLVRSNKTAVQAGVAAATAMLLSPKAEGTVVFDGGNRNKMLRHNGGVNIRFSGKGTEADDVLVQLAAAQVATDSGAVVVVTSDRALALRLLDVGARVLKGSHFAQLTAPPR